MGGGDKARDVRVGGAAAAAAAAAAAGAAGAGAATRRSGVGYLVSRMTGARRSGVETGGRGR